MQPSPGGGLRAGRNGHRPCSRNLLVVLIRLNLPRRLATHAQLVGRGSHPGGADASERGSAAASMQLGALHPAPSSPLSEVPSVASDATDAATTDASKLPQGFGEGACAHRRARQGRAQWTEEHTCCAAAAAVPVA